MITRTVCDMRGAGKPGYVAKILDNRDKSFLVAKSYDRHGTSAKNVTFEITEDGIYEICDANFGGRKRRITFILVQNGEITCESELLNECEKRQSGFPEWTIEEQDNAPMISDRTVTPEGLPKLTGTTRQIEWAESLRDRALQYIWEQGWHGTEERFITDMRRLPTDAKWWIENRSPQNSTHDAARRFLGLEYTTPAGSDY